MGTKERPLVRRRRGSGGGGREGGYQAGWTHESLQHIACIQSKRHRPKKRRLPASSGCACRAGKAVRWPVHRSKPPTDPHTRSRVNSATVPKWHAWVAGRLVEDAIVPNEPVSRCTGLPLTQRHPPTVCKQQKRGTMSAEQEKPVGESPDGSSARPASVRGAETPHRPGRQRAAAGAAAAPHAGCHCRSLRALDGATVPRPGHQRPERLPRRRWRLMPRLRRGARRRARRP